MFVVTSVINAQRGKEGVLNVTSGDTLIVNEYTYLTSSAAAGASSLSVNNSGLNANSRFTSGLAAGDLVMIIQVQGASIRGSLNVDIGNPNDSTWGEITNYNNCGNFEYAEVSAVPNASTIELACALENSYSDTGDVQVVRVPRYDSLVFNGGQITGEPWNGQTGGVLAIEVLNNTHIDGGGEINMTAKGFRGGELLENLSGWNWSWQASTEADYGAEKGEGIYGWKGDYYSKGGRYCRGAAANAGGGGAAHNGGGGGGANAGNITFWNGKGNPDTSLAGWKAAWNLEYPGFATNTSAGGGKGGYTFFDTDQDATTTPPGDLSWGGDYRQNHGGLGGRPLDYTLGKLFLGGGGGAGDQNDDDGGEGGNGGGLIYFKSYGDIDGNGQIVSNGEDGDDAVDPGSPAFGTTTGKDAAGGGGAGGTVVIDNIGPVSGISLHADGGEGGDQVMKAGSFASKDEAEGPGGGGGGGYIGIANGTPVTTALGGINGTTNSDYLPEFPPNGATMGGEGIPLDAINSYAIIANDDTVCGGSSVTASVTVVGTLPAGVTIGWYDQPFNGTQLGTGTTYNYFPTSDTTFYVRACPGSYYIPVSITVSPGPVANAGNDSTICGGDSLQLNGSGGVSYLWDYDLSLSDSTISNPYASPSSTTTYYLTVTDAAGCTDRDTVTVTVSGGVSVDAGTNASVCSGDSIQLNATGAINYLWDYDLSLSDSTIANPYASPSGTTTYYVTGTDASGCEGRDSVQITVDPLPPVDAGNNVTICIGDSTQLNATGGVNYNWDYDLSLSDSTIANPYASPSSTTTYYLTGTDASGCSATDSVTVTVEPAPNVDAGSNLSICAGDSIQLNATGAASYNWDYDLSLSDSTIANPYASPSVTTTYYVTGTSSTGCTARDSVTVSISSSISVDAGIDTSVCVGDSVQLNATGAISYNWDYDLSLSDSTIANPYATPPSTTTYYVMGTSSSGCTGRDSVEVTVNPLPNVNAGNNQVICMGDSVQLNGTGAVNYNWDYDLSLSDSTISNPYASPTATTTYYLTGSNSSGCEARDSVVITVEPLPNVDAGNNITICSGDSTQLTATGASSYNWDYDLSLGDSTIANPYASPSATTTYYVTGTSAAGCTARDSVTVSVSSGLNVNTNNDTTICNGDSIQLSASGANSYNWDYDLTLSDSTISNPYASPSATTTYYVTGTNSSGCTGRDSVTITVNPPVNATTMPDTIICPGSSVTIFATGSGGSGSYTYSWDNGLGAGASHTVSPGSVTTYTVTVTDGFGCQVSDSVTVGLYSPLNVAVSSSDSIVCSSDTVAISASATGGFGSYTYNWTAGGSPAGSGSSISDNPVTTTTYIVTVSDALCGSVSDSVEVNVTSPPAVDFSVTDTSGCEPLSVQFQNNSGAGTYLWSFGDGDNSTLSSPSHIYNAGSYNVRLTVSIGGCDSSLEKVAYINVDPSPLADFDYNPVSPVTEGTSVNFTDQSASGITQWSWEIDDNVFNDQNPSYKFNTKGSYEVCLTVSNTQSCSDSVCKTVEVEEEVVEGPVPNIFSPNDDGKNDVFRVEGMDKGTGLSIYNRWGQMIFNTDLPEHGWDGRTSAGAKSPDGTYLFILEKANGEKETGTLTLIR